MTASDDRFSHSSPQRLQASAHALQMRSAKGPALAEMHAADPHTDAQSWHVRSVTRWSFLPSASMAPQWSAHWSHASAHWPHALAQSANSAAWAARDPPGWPAANGKDARPITAASDTATNFNMAARSAGGYRATPVASQMPRRGGRRTDGRTCG